MKTFTLFSLLLPVLPVLAADKAIFLDSWGPINSGLNSKIVPVPVTKRNPWVESIPEACVYEAQKHFSDSVPVPRCKVDDMRVVEVSFGDAPGTTWITCRCKDTEFTEAQFFAQLGRVPVAARQTIRFLMGFKRLGGSAGMANNVGDLLVFQDDANVYFHETAHRIDEGRSRSAEYIAAADQDTCMVTPYALSNYQKNKHYVEAWAETFVLRRYQLQVGALPGSAAKVACVQKQLNVMAKQTDAQIQAGYNAAKRVQPGKIIKRANVKRSLAEGNGGLDRRSELEEEDDGKMEYFDEVGEYRVYEPIERQSPQEDAAEEAEEEEHGHDHYDVYPAHFDGNYTLFEPEE